MAQGEAKSPDDGWEEAVVVLERPPSEALQSMHRGERYEILRQTAGKRRDDLVTYLNGCGLADQVEISESNSFNMLFVRGAPTAIAALREAPGVAEVLPGGGKFRADLLGA